MKFSSKIKAKLGIQKKKSKDDGGIYQAELSKPSVVVAPVSEFTPGGSRVHPVIPQASDYDKILPRSAPPQTHNRVAAPSSMSSYAPAPAPRYQPTNTPALSGQHFPVVAPTYQHTPSHAYGSAVVQAPRTHGYSQSMTPTYIHAPSNPPPATRYVPAPMSYPNPRLGSTYARSPVNSSSSGFDGPALGYDAATGPPTESIRTAGLKNFEAPVGGGQSTTPQRKINPENNMNVSARHDHESIMAAIQKMRNVRKQNGNAGEWVTEPSFHETRQLLGKAYSGLLDVQGNESSNWALNHVGELWYTADEHREVLAFTTGFRLSPHWGHKTRKPLVVSKRLTSGSVVSAAVVTEFDPSIERHRSMETNDTAIHRWRHAVGYAKMAINDGKVPKLFRDRKFKETASHAQKKLDAIATTVHKWHVDETAAPQNTHWYLAMVGVDPAYSRKGYGRQVMDMVHRLADEAGVQIYLECNSETWKFFEKMGYRVIKIDYVKDPVKSGRSACKFCIMIRDPQKA